MLTENISITDMPQDILYKSFVICCIQTALLKYIIILEMWVTYEAEPEKIQCKKNYGRKVYGKENLVHQGSQYVKNYLLRRVMKHTSLGREREHQARAAAHACHSAPLYISTYVIHHCWIALELNSIIKL